MIRFRLGSTYLWSFYEDVRLYPAISAADEEAIAQMLFAVVRRAISQGRYYALPVSIVREKRF